MTPEVARRHYLEAMGITAWACRFQLPNALPTEACEWDDAPAAEPPPRERLQALLDDAPAPRQRAETPGPQTGSQTESQAQPQARSQTQPDVPAGSASPSAVKALLAPGAAPSASRPAATPAAATPSEATQPLQFSLSCVCIGGRWLSLHVGEIAPREQQLLANVLQAAGLLSGKLPAVTVFKWPPMASAFTPEDPLDEAQQGVGAFIAGAAGRQGWQLQRVLCWGASDAADDSPFASVMAIREEHSETLKLPVWQGPSLSQLVQSASAKRQLWPQLVALGQQWRAASS